MVIDTDHFYCSTINFREGNDMHRILNVIVSVQQMYLCPKNVYTKKSVWFNHNIYVIIHDITPKEYYVKVLSRRFP